MVDNELLINIKRNAAEYAYLPAVLFEYLENAIENDVREELLPALSGPDRKDVLYRIDEMFRLACLTCNMKLNEFVANLGIEPNDTAYGRLDASFAIVRVINRLRTWGFSSIRPLKAGKKKTADLYCEYSGIHCVGEVFCSPRKHFRYYIERARGKKTQLDITALELSCEKKICILVFNSFEAQATLIHEDFLCFLKRIYDVLSWGRNYHFMLMTGMQDAFAGIPDDAIFPPIDNAATKLS
jgi:hypothetical protein